MSTPIVVPAPTHLSPEAAQQWQAAYRKAFAQAQRDIPENESAQRAAALKSANALLAVSAPTSAAEIDTLEPWQILLRETRTVNGQAIRVCVTSDGQKYSFPVVEPVQAVEPALDPAGDGKKKAAK